MSRRAAARIAALLLVLTAAGFVIGARAESGDKHSEGTVTADSHNESTEATEGEAHDEEVKARPHDESRQERSVLGLDPEAPTLVGLAALVSLGLAIGSDRSPPQSVAIAAAVFAAAFAVLDVVELLRQLDENHTDLALLATVIAVGHTAAAFAAGYAALSPRSTTAPRRTA